MTMNYYKILIFLLLIYYNNAEEGFLTNIETMKENNYYNYIYYVNPIINYRRNCGFEIKNSCNSISNAIKSFKEQTDNLYHKHQSLTLLLMDGIYNLNKENSNTIMFGMNLTIKPFNKENPKIVLTGSISDKNNSFITIINNKYNNRNFYIRLIDLNFQHIKSTIIINNIGDGNGNTIELINNKITDSIDIMLISNLKRSNLVITNLQFKNNNDILHQKNFSAINIESSNILLNNTNIENNRLSNTFIYDNFNSTIIIYNNLYLNNNNNNNNFLFCKSNCYIEIYNNNLTNLVTDSTKSNNNLKIKNCYFTNKESCKETEIISNLKINRKFGSGSDYSNSNNSSQEKQFMKSLEIFLICIGLIFGFIMIVSAIYYLNKCYLKYHPDYYSENDYEIIPDL